jgi:hypothetical protein
MKQLRFGWVGAAWLVVALAPGVAAGQSGTAQSSEAKVSQACSDAAFRRFDYWLGAWMVTDTAGKQVGTNHVIRVSDGCAILEQWKDASGNAGTSLNFYDRSADRWEQTWMGAQGGILHLRGGLENGVMTLTGVRKTAQGEVMDRIEWIPVEGGKVRQLWSLSRDGGKTWQVAFNGMYSPTHPGT